MAQYHNKIPVYSIFYLLEGGIYVPEFRREVMTDHILRQLRPCKQHNLDDRMGDASETRGPLHCDTHAHEILDVEVHEQHPSRALTGEHLISLSCRILLGSTYSPHSTLSLLGSLTYNPLPLIIKPPTPLIINFPNIL